MKPSGLAMLPSNTVYLRHLLCFPIDLQSNGALLQLITGSYFSEKIPKKANAIISFNNRPVSEAVPYFEQYIANLASNKTLVLPVPAINVINGGSHAGNKLAMQGSHAYCSCPPSRSEGKQSKLCLKQGP